MNKLTKAMFVLKAAAIFFINLHASELTDINELKWKNRIILIKTSDDGSVFVSQLNKWDYEVRDRHIYWFVINDSLLKTNYQGEISQKFSSNILEEYYKENEDSVILVGKDGGLKKQSKELDLNLLFGLIDRMPMRQSEMRR